MTWWPICAHWDIKREKNAIILEIAIRRAKWSEIWNSVVLVENIWENFDLIMLKVILGSFGALVIFLTTRFLHRCFFYTYDYFSTKFYSRVSEIGTHGD